MLTSGQRPPALRAAQVRASMVSTEPLARSCSGEARSQTRWFVRHCHRVNGRRASPLPVVPTAANRAAHRSQDPQDGADDQQDDPNRPQNRDLGDQADDEQDQPNNDHEVSIPSRRCVIVQGLPPPGGRFDRRGAGCWCRCALRPTSKWAWPRSWPGPHGRTLPPDAAACTLSSSWRPWQPASRGVQAWDPSKSTPGPGRRPPASSPDRRWRTRLVHASNQVRVLVRHDLSSSCVIESSIDGDVGPKPWWEAELEPAPSLGRVGDGEQQQTGVRSVHPSGRLAGVRQAFSVSRTVAWSPSSRSGRVTWCGSGRVRSCRWTARSSPGRPPWTSRCLPLIARPASVPPTRRTWRLFELPTSRGARIGVESDGAWAAATSSEHGTAGADEGSALDLRRRAASLACRSAVSSPTTASKRVRSAPSAGSACSHLSANSRESLPLPFSTSEMRVVEKPVRV